MRSACVLAHALGGVALTAALAGPPPAAYAATPQFVPCSGTGGGAAGLTDAVVNANSAGSGDIQLASNCTYVFKAPSSGTSALPTINGNIVISGSSSTITRDPNATPFRIARVGTGSDTGSLTLSGITISGGNLTAPNNGGGITVENGSELSLKSSKVTGNRAPFGGGILNFGLVKLHKSLIADNHATNAGGAVFNDNRGTLRALDSTFANNTANGPGGAIATFNSLTVLTRSTVTGNKAASGGGINVSPGSTLQLKSSKIVDNRNIANVSALGIAGGIFNSGNVNLFRSDITGNDPNNCAGTLQVPGCSG